MRVRRCALWIAAGVLTLVLHDTATLAFAQERSIRVETAKSTTPNGKPAAALLVNGQIVAQLAKDQRSRTPLRNISVAASQIAVAYRSGSADLTVKATDNSGRRYALFLNGKVLLVATDMEGKAWGAAPYELAYTWRDNLLKAWDLQPAADEGAAGPAAVAEAEVSAAPVAQDAGTAGVLAQPAAAVRASPALAKLTISGGHDVYEPPSHTRLADAAVPTGLTAQVTGRKPSAQVARSSIEQTIISHARLHADTSLEWRVTSPPQANLEIPPGKQQRLGIEYRPGVGQAASQVDVLLENRVLALPREGLTFFSNGPERVLEPQLLYQASLPPRESGRLVFHHQNQSREDLRLVARVLNSGSQDAAVHVIPGIAEPDINTFYVGFKSAELFWYNLNAGTGYVLRLAPGEQAFLARQWLAPGYTGSGYCKLTNLSDTPLRLDVLTLARGQTMPGATVGSGAASHGVFPAPYRMLTASYEAGDPWLYLRLGADFPQSLTNGDVLHGCYGMTHSFNVELSNPRDRPALVFVVLRGSAGEVKGQFFIDDEYVVTPLVASGDEQLLKEVPLKPGETKLLKIKAMPLNGGFYPASIILRESRYP